MNHHKLGIKLTPSILILWKPFWNRTLSYNGNRLSLKSF